LAILSGLGPGLLESNSMAEDQKTPVSLFCLSKKAWGKTEAVLRTVFAIVNIPALQKAWEPRATIWQKAGGVQIQAAKPVKVRAAPFHDL